MRQTTKAHRACLPPHIPFAKSDYSQKEEKKEKDRICQGPNCQSERKERFAQKYVKKLTAELKIMRIYPKKINFLKNSKNSEKI